MCTPYFLRVLVTREPLTFILKTPPSQQRLKSRFHLECSANDVFVAPTSFCQKAAQDILLARRCACGPYLNVHKRNRESNPSER